MPRGRFTAEQVVDLLVGTDSMSLPFDSQEDDPQPAQDAFTHGDTTAENDDDVRGFHLDAETVTCKTTLVKMRWCPSLM